MESREPSWIKKYRTMPQEVRNFSATTRHMAGLTTDFIDDSWKGEEGDPELVALRHALLLDRQCVRILDGQLSELPVSLKERYELQAACLIVHHTIPFLDGERQSLIMAAGLWDESSVVWEERATEPHRELLGQWSAWLLLDSASRASYDEQSLTDSPAAILEQGASHIEELFSIILD
jgi:hypothetical protein